MKLFLASHKVSLHPSLTFTSTVYDPSSTVKPLSNEYLMLPQNMYPDVYTFESSFCNAARNSAIRSWGTVTFRA